MRASVFRGLVRLFATSVVVGSLAACTGAPAPASISSLLSHADRPSGCSSPNLFVAVPGGRSEPIESCAAGTVTHFDVVVTIRAGETVRVYWTSSQNALPGGNAVTDDGLLLRKRNVGSATADSVTGRHRGTTDVRGYGPLYCLANRSTDAPVPTRFGSTSPSCQLFTLEVTD